MSHLGLDLEQRGADGVLRMLGLPRDWRLLVAQVSQPADLAKGKKVRGARFRGRNPGRCSIWAHVL